VSYCCLSRIVQTEEEEFGVLVGQAKLRQDIPDCALISASCLRSHTGSWICRRTPVDDPHVVMVISMVRKRDRSLISSNGGGGGGGGE